MCPCMSSLLMLCRLTRKGFRHLVTVCPAWERRFFSFPNVGRQCLLGTKIETMASDFTQSWLHKTSLFCLSGLRDEVVAYECYPRDSQHDMLRRGPRACQNCTIVVRYSFGTVATPRFVVRSSALELAQFDCWLWQRACTR